MSDPFELQRFIDAQDGGAYERALAELRAGRKTGHWIWFIFPQLAGLGRSPTAQRYAISGLHEAREYLSHPVLGRRLTECCEALMALPHHVSATSVLGELDAMKLRSSMTLFARAIEAESIYGHVLERFYGGEADEATERLLAGGSTES